MSFMPRKKAPVIAADEQPGKTALKNVQVLGMVPSHHTPIPEQRVSMDSRHPLGKQWHRRMGKDGRKITQV